VRRLSKKKKVEKNAPTPHTTKQTKLSAIMSTAARAIYGSDSEDDIPLDELLGYEHSDSKVASKALYSRICKLLTARADCVVDSVVPAFLGLSMDLFFLSLSILMH
jgi:hypothetical protein